jgi:large conductance mechanosensitive channel
MESFMWKEFKEFAMRGNVIDMAVGIIIGAAFGIIVRSLVDDLVMPPIGLILGNVDFSNLFLVLKPGVDIQPPYATVEEAQAAGAVTINYGRFINNIVSFFIVALSIFILIKAVTKTIRKQEEIPAEAPTTKECPYCLTKISLKASRCPSCTSQLEAA